MRRAQTSRRITGRAGIPEPGRRLRANRRAHRDGAAVAAFGAASDFGATATEGARTGGLADALLEAAPTTRAPRSSGGTGPTWSSHGSGAGNSEPPATQTS